MSRSCLKRRNSCARTRRLFLEQFESRVLLAFSVTAFDPTVWPRTDAALGVTGYAIEDFEDSALVPGLQVEVSDSTDNYGPTGTLPLVFDPNTDDPNAAKVFAAGVWDGAHVLINRRTPPPVGYVDFAWGDTTFD